MTVLRCHCCTGKTKRLLWYSFALAICLLSTTVQAFVEFSGLDGITINAWNGNGGLTGSDQYCIVSKRSATSTTRVRYDVAVYGPSDASGNFVLELQNNTAVKLPITLTWAGNRGSYTMSNYSQTGYTTPRQNGALDCLEQNSIATITVDVSSAALASARAGTYVGTFRVDTLQLSSPRRYLVQSFRITIPEMYQITNLDDINLGNFNGVTDMVGEDLLCVYRNGASTYGLTANGGASATADFLLHSGDVSLPFSVALRDQSGNFIDVSPGQQITGLAGSALQNCGGTTNTAIRISVSKTDLEAVQPGAFSGTVYITASPE